MIATTSLTGLDTDITVSVTEPATLGSARREVARHAENIDLTVNRRRASAEIHAVDLAAGTPVMVSVVFEQILTDALFHADLTGGATQAVRRSSVPDYRHLPHLRFTTDGPLPVVVRTVSPIPAWHRPRLGDGCVTVPADVRIELLTAGHAFLADMAAHLVGERLGCGVMVAVGGVAASAGHPPLGGWHVASAPAIGELELPQGHAMATVSAADIAALPRGPFDPRPVSGVTSATVVADHAGTAQAAATLMHTDPTRARAWILEEQMSAWSVDRDGTVDEFGPLAARLHAHAA
ncbi:MAG: FAD:protein FMN transferase [Corynebacteriales bacterium]|uniref:FAD:protein FMN transferase n=1 Tax=Williamsia herbipolensis TaxID=1603258 RepID=A0AAU4JZN1_9NOCA|nr:FAD:protein FMN transferase [Williamsia herbipolensis]MCX6468415.1 FAD:protein FMN transferase [Mycobacteriales bacterium]